MFRITISKRAAVVIAFAVVLAIPGIAGATHIFTDVTDGSVHAEGIEWVANAQVTAGCGDGSTYCPNDPVTRAQMGTFMYRLSGHAPGVPPSVNADQLDGQDSNEILPIMFGQSDAEGGGTTKVAQGMIEVNTRTFAVPDDGYLVISGTVFVRNNSVGVLSYVLVPKVDGAEALTPPWAGTFFAGGAGAGGSRFMLPYTVVVPITQGIHVVSQEVGPFVGVADFFFNQQNLVVTFYPESQGFINQNSTPASTGLLSPMGE